MVKKKIKHRRQKRARTGGEKLIKVGKFLAPILLKGAQAGVSAGKKHLTKENAQKVQKNVSSLISKLKTIKADLKRKKLEKKYVRTTMSRMRK